MDDTARKTFGAGGVVIGPDGRIIVVNQHGLAWSLPKGHIDPGEDALTTAKREIYEETGISENELLLVRELGTYQRYRMAKDGSDDRREFKTITIFLFTTTAVELKPIDPVNPEARWVAIDDVEPLLTHAKDKAFFVSIKNQLATT